MRKTIATAVASLVALTACAPMRTLTGGAPFNPRNPKVYVVESKGEKAVVVDQEPIYFFKEDGTQIQIRWQLQTSGYRFDPTTGISGIRPLFGPSGQLHSCRVEADSKDEAFVCVYENTARGRSKYTIHVVSTQGSGDPRPLDPTIGND